MRTRTHYLTPLAAVMGGALAGAVGTVCLDAVQYLKYRRSGGTHSPLAWDLSGHLAYGAGTGAAFWILARIL